MRSSATFVLVANLALSGCASSISLQADVAKQVEQLESQQEYGRALDVLALVPSDHPDHARLNQKRIQVEARAKLYEQSMIRRAGEHVAQNRWTEAQDVYRQALAKLPNSQALRADLKEFRHKQDQRIEELKLEQLLGRARFLERAISVQESLVNTDPGNSAAKRELQRLRNDALGIAEELTRLGLAALDKSNLAVAGRTLPIAARLNPTTLATEAKEQLNVQQAAKAKEQRTTQEKAMDRLRQQETQGLLAEYRQAFQGGDLRRSRLLMDRLQELDGKNPEVISEQNRLKAHMDAQVKKSMDAGVRLYGRGKYQESIDSWNKVLEIDPANEQARNSIERASRVLEKLRQLREKQSPASQATPR